MSRLYDEEEAAAAAGEAFRAPRWKPWQERAVSCEARAKAAGITVQNGSCHDVSVSHSYETEGGKKSKRVKVPDNGAKEEERGLNLIQPAVRVGPKQRLWC